MPSLPNVCILASPPADTLAYNLFRKEVIELTKHKTNQVAVPQDSYIYASKKPHLSGVKLTVHFPEMISENTRKQKINRIYDILNPKISQ